MTTTMPSSARIFRSRRTTAPTSPTPLPSTKSLPLEQQVLVTTGSQGEEMSALYRMAFSQHKQIDVGPGDRASITCWIRWTLEAKVVTMIRCLQPLNKRSKVLPTMDSLMV